MTNSTFFLSAVLAKFHRKLARKEEPCLGEESKRERARGFSCAEVEAKFALAGMVVVNYSEGKKKITIIPPSPLYKRGVRGDLMSIYLIPSL